MEFEEWEPLYERILEEFNFSRRADEEAARSLDELLAHKDVYPLELLRRKLANGVTVCGNAPGLEDALLTCDLSGAVIAADGATSALLHVAGRVPDVIVTDLDGDVADQISANSQGAVVIIHAHGDNVDAMKRYVPRMPGKVMGTTQSKPFGRLHNFGGFTDGDRAVLMARHLGAPVRLLGFDFDKPRLKEGRDVEVKKRKLAWARRLICDTDEDEHCSAINLDLS